MRGFLRRVTEHVGDMPRTGRPRKPEDQKYRGLHIKLPPALLEKLERLIPEGRRSEFIRDALARALNREEKKQKDGDDA